MRVLSSAGWSTRVLIPLLGPPAVHPPLPGQSEVVVAATRHRANPDIAKCVDGARQPRVAQRAVPELPADMSRTCHGRVLDGSGSRARAAPSGRGKKKESGRGASISFLPPAAAPPRVHAPLIGESDRVVLAGSDGGDALLLERVDAARRVRVVARAVPKPRVLRDGSGRAPRRVREGS